MFGFNGSLFDLNEFAHVLAAIQKTEDVSFASGQDLEAAWVSVLFGTF